MFEIDLLIERVQTYAHRAGIAESTASFRVFGSGNQLDRLKKGASCRVNTANAAWQKLEKLEQELARVSNHAV